MKFYTRARAARAALVKVLEAHEITDYEIEVVVKEDEKGANIYGANVTATLEDAIVRDALVADLDGRFGGNLKLAITFDEEPGSVEYPATADENPADELAPTPAQPSGYINETSKFKGATKRVWSVADSMPGATRKQVVDACRAEGIAYGTARTQYQAWFAANKKA